MHYSYKVLFYRRSQLYLNFLHMLVVVWPVTTSHTTTNNAATTTLQGKTRGC
jgi:hypothetical protein